MRKIFILVLATVVALIGGSVYSAGMPLPFSEDFTGVEEGGLPPGWSSDDTGWQVSNTNLADGETPEMVLFNYGIGYIDETLRSPLIDGTTASKIICRFKHTVLFQEGPPFPGCFYIEVLTSIDNGATWQTPWQYIVDQRPIEPATVEVDLSSVAGNEFYLAFRSWYETYNLKTWHIDDIFIGESAEPTPTPTPEPKSLPFIEDFAGMEKDEIPEYWTATHHHWGARQTAYAGSVLPEMMFFNRSNLYNNARLITPLLDGASVDALVCQFDHSVMHYDHWWDTFNLEVQTSIDNGDSWQTQREWAPLYSISPETVMIDLSAVAGKEFQVAFNVKGHTNDLYRWNIDNVCIGEPINLTVLASDGNGVTEPAAGVHTVVKDAPVTLRGMGNPGYKLDYWEVDGERYSSQLVTTLMMDVEHTVQAFFTIDPSQLCEPDDLFAQPVQTVKDAVNSDAHKEWDFAADDFTGVVEPIFGVDFWGIENDNKMSIPCEKPSLDYIIRFYEYGPVPGALIYEETITVTKAPTTKFLINYPYYFGAIHKYSAQLSAPVTLESGWLSVRAVDSGSCVFRWADAGPIGSDYSCVRYIEDEWKYDDNDHNLAFCLLGEPTPDYPLGVRLEMPQTAHPGDEFYVTGYLDNPGDPLSEVPTFFILEVYGKFWFWPSWAYFDYPEYAEIDFNLIDVPFGTTEIVVIPLFEWPDTGSDIVTGLGFYGAMLNPEMTDIMGEIAYKEWGYGPSR
ncbi:MAG: hypothetical protein WBM02_00115 [bacterium]